MSRSAPPQALPPLRLGGADAGGLRDLAKRRPVMFLSLIFSAYMVYYPARQLIAERDLPLPRDLQPGLVVQAPAYAPPSDCPVRAWGVGEFLPRACIFREALARDGEPASLGLEVPRNVYWHTRRGLRYPNYRERFWVRAGDDALLVSGPFASSAEILGIVKGRFHADAAALQAGPPGDIDYRKMPDDYGRAVRTNLWTEAWFMGLALLVVWTWGLSKLWIGPPGADAPDA